MGRAERNPSCLDADNGDRLGVVQVPVGRMAGYAQLHPPYEFVRLIARRFRLAPNCRRAIPPDRGPP